MVTHFNYIPKELIIIISSYLDTIDLRKFIKILSNPVNDGILLSLSIKNFGSSKFYNAFMNLIDNNIYLVKNFIIDTSSET